jgi:hypothetical protein
VMCLGGAGAIDVQHFVPLRNQPIGHEHTVALKIQTLGTHVDRGGSVGKRDEFVYGMLELRRKHVVGIVAKALVAKRNIWRIVEDLLPVAAERFHPNVVHPGRCKALLKRLAVELRQPSGSRESADVDQSLNLMRAQHRDQIVNGTGRMSDGVKSSQRKFDADSKLFDAQERGGNLLILVGEYRPQIKQHPAVLHARDDWRIA